MDWVTTLQLEYLRSSVSFLSLRCAITVFLNDILRQIAPVINDRRPYAQRRVQGILAILLVFITGHTNDKTDPTRNDQSSATLIDLAFTTDSGKVVVSEVLDCSKSNHSGSFLDA